MAELPVSEALMSAAQTISDKKYTWHHTKEECEGGPGLRLSLWLRRKSDCVYRRFHGGHRSTRPGQLAQLPGHFETMIKPDCDSIGVGVTERAAA